MKKIITILLLMGFGLLGFYAEKTNALIPENKNDSTNNLNTNTEEEKVNVILMAGDFNMVGYAYSNCLYDSDNRTNVSLHKYNEFLNGYDNVLIKYRNMFFDSIVNQNTHFSKVKLGQGRDTDSIGPELGLAEYMSIYYPNQTTLIIKYGTAWKSELGVEWNVTTGDYYLNMITYMKNALIELENTNINYQVIAFCFAQGEGDAENNCFSYPYFLNEFTNKIRDEFKEFGRNNELAFIDCGISQWYVGNHNNGYEVLNNIKYEHSLSSPYNFYLDTINEGLTYNLDNREYMYYDAYSQLLLGKIIGKAVTQFLNLNS